MKYLSVPIYMSTESEGTIPSYAYEDSDAGCDLYAAETITILPRSCEGVDLQFSTAIPQGYYGKIESRSGLAKNNLITAVGGVIDSNFRGDWQVCLFNHGKLPYTVKPGDKIAQVIFHKKETVRFWRVEKESDLGKTKRGKKGFGSSDSKKSKLDEESADYSCDPNHPSYSCGSQPLPTDYNTPEEESDDDCEITGSSGEMRNEKGDIISKY